MSGERFNFWREMLWASSRHIDNFRPALRWNLPLQVFGGGCSRAAGIDRSHPSVRETVRKILPSSLFPAAHTEFVETCPPSWKSPLIELQSFTHICFPGPELLNPSRLDYNNVIIRSDRSEKKCRFSFDASKEWSALRNFEVHLILRGKKIRFLSKNARVVSSLFHLYRTYTERRF